MPFAPGNRLLVGTNDGSLVPVEAGKESAATEVLTSGGPVQQMESSLDGRTVAISVGSSVQVWRPDKDQKHRLASAEAYEHEGRVLCADVSRNGQLVATGTGTSHRYLWDLSEARLLSKKSVGTALVSMNFTADGSVLCTADRNNEVKIWDVKSLQNFTTLERTAERVSSMAVSDVGEFLAIGDRDGTISLWNLEQRRRVHHLPGHADTITSLDFSPDGATLVSGCRDSMVKIWDVETGELQLELSEHRSAVHDVAFSTHSEMLATCSNDGVIRFWQADLR